MNRWPIIVAKSLSVLLAVGVCGYLIWGAQTSAQSPTKNPSPSTQTNVNGSADAGVSGDAGSPAIPVLLPSSKSGVLPQPTETLRKTDTGDPRPPALLHSTKVLVLDRPSSDIIWTPPNEGKDGPESQPAKQPSSQPLKQPTSQPLKQPSSQPSKQPTRAPTALPTSEKGSDEGNE